MAKRNAGGIVLGTIFAALIVGIGFDFLFSWLFSVVLNHTFYLHLGALRLFWLVFVSNSFVSYASASAVRATK